MVRGFVLPLFEENVNGELSRSVRIKKVKLRRSRVGKFGSIYEDNWHQK